MTVTEKYAESNCILQLLAYFPSQHWIDHILGVYPSFLLESTSPFKLFPMIIGIINFLKPESKFAVVEKKRSLHHKSTDNYDEL